MVEHHEKFDKLAITSRQKFEAFIYVNNCLILDRITSGSDPAKSLERRLYSEDRPCCLRRNVTSSVVVGDPNRQDPHGFGPPESGSLSQRCGSGSESFPFLINVLSGLK